MRKQYFKTLLKVGIGLGATYWLLTTAYFGHSEKDDVKGRYNFHWSGLKAWGDAQKFGIKVNQAIPTEFEDKDGVYIIDSTIYWVDANHQLVTAQLKTHSKIMIAVGNQDNDQFEIVWEEPQQIAEETYKMPEKLIAISDIEGNFNGFYSFLVNNGVMNKNYEWTFGKGHLVLNGDFVDRGKNVTQVLWLIYSLEQQAAKKGGKVHFILGNHEIMNMYGDASYAEEKYHAIAKKLSNQEDWDKANRYVYGTKSAMGRWLRTKNIIEKIGSYIFVHAGLKAKYVDLGLSISKINQIARKYYGDFATIPTDEAEKVILSSSDSPYWDRGLAMSWLYKGFFFFRNPLGTNYYSTSQEDLDKVLNFLQAQKVVIGHSIVDDITKDYEHKVIKIDLKHGQDKSSGQTKGLYIENGVEYKTDDLGNKTKL